MKRIQNIFPLLVSLVAAYTAGLIGSFYTGLAIPTWYDGLLKPTVTPPSWLFGPVWIVLYAMMAFAAWRVYESSGKKKLAKPALVIYTIHLFVNAAWSIVFFGAHNIPVALGVILLLVALISILVVLFSRIDKIAGMLMFPYLWWVCFATYLNLVIFLMN